MALFFVRVYMEKAKLLKKNSSNILFLNEEKRRYVLWQSL